ncbi:MAG: murein transglycosylase, partial [Proteobacteria bacterium]|nr:murein transglycosylase [Pseudomonadota bacterium]
GMLLAPALILLVLPALILRFSSRQPDRSIPDVLPPAPEPPAPPAGENA